MSVAVAYDTLKIARQLTAAGLTPEVAEGVSETFAGILADREDSLATKADVLLVRSDLTRVESVLRSDMQALRHELRSEIRVAVADQTKWMMAAMVAVSGLLFAALKLAH